MYKTLLETKKGLARKEYSFYSLEITSDMYLNVKGKNKNHEVVIIYSDWLSEGADELEIILDEWLTQE